MKRPSTSTRKSPLHMHAFLQELAKERPVFHSEGDFQHALGCRIPKRGWVVYAEYKTSYVSEHGEEKRARIDLVLLKGQDVIAVELKYETVCDNWSHIGNKYRLKNQGAPDETRYAYWADVHKLERLVGIHRADDNLVFNHGYAILLSNHEALWRPPQKSRPRPNDSDFRLHLHSVGGKTLEWGNTKKAPIDLASSYQLNWRPYGCPEGTLGSEPRRQFKYLLIEVRPDTL